MRSLGQTANLVMIMLKLKPKVKGTDAPNMQKEKIKTVIIPYVPRALWKHEIHPKLESHRFSVIVAHRRFGKTVGVINHLIKKAVKNNLRAPQYAYVAPYFKQAKMIAWMYLQYYTSTIPGIKVNKSDHYVEFPSKHKGLQGARIYIIGADNPDALRGTYWDGVILDEYAQMKSEVWGEIIRPALSDRKGWAVFIGTPKGQNKFYEIYQKALKRDSWYVCLYRADETGVIDDEELSEMKADMTPVEIRQELLCDFTASAYNILITIDMVTDAANRILTKRDVYGAPRVLGVDVARFGDDRSVIFKREGLAAYEPIIFQDIDNMTLASRIVEVIREFKPNAVFIDAGRGEGVIDRLRQLGYKVIEVNFGSKATDDKSYINKRTEMWDKTRQWLKAGGGIPNISELKTELSTPEYTYDAKDRKKLESKDKIKERVGSSPDIADALALTFAEHVTITASPIKEREGQRQEYDPFSNIA